MLTVNDIKEAKFRKTNIGGGYKAEDVDNFLDDVQASYEELQRENLNLKQKIKILADKVSQYRKDEDSVRDALVGAKKLANSELSSAKEQAKNIIENAQKEAALILKNADCDISAQKETLLGLKKAVRDFRSDILAKYKEHLKLVNSFNAEDRLPANFDDKINEKIESDNKNFNDEIDSNLEESIGIKDTSVDKFSNLQFGEGYDVREDSK